MLKRIIILFFILCTSATAQYNFLYRQYVLNQLGLNPGYTGSREVFVVAGHMRAQWLGVEGAPVTETVAADAPLKKNKIAIGFYAINEKIATTRNTNFDINYAYRIPMRVGKLSFGLKTSLNTFNTKQPGELNNTIDQVFAGDNRSYFFPNFGVGVYYYDFNRFFFGLSVPSLLNYKNSDTDEGYEIENNVKYYNFLGSAGVLVNINEKLKWRLSSLAQYSMLTSFDCDVNTMFIIDNLVWVGGSYHTSGIMVFMAQYQVNPQLKVGYSYDYSMGLLNYLGGSHEIMLRYEFSYIIKAVSPIFF